MTKKPIRVSLAVFPESDPSMFYGVFDTLWAAGQLWNAIHGLPPGAPLFEPRIVGVRAGPMQVVTGVSIIVQNSIDDVSESDVVFVPNVLISSPASLRSLDRRLLAWIRGSYEQGAAVYAACAGPLAIAEAGLLDGLEATTHWAYCNLFRKEFPQVTVHAERILVPTGLGHRIVTSGGSSSWQDLVLYLITKHAGVEGAARVEAVPVPMASRWPAALRLDDPVIRAQQTWIAENYNRPNIVTELTRRSGLPDRTFARRFKSTTGYTPISYIQALRVEEAKYMLETSDVPVESIGREVGYEDIAYFRRLFRRLTGMTPADYRRRFRLPAVVQQAAE